MKKIVTAKMFLLGTILLLPVDSFSDFSDLSLEEILNTKVTTAARVKEQKLSEVPASIHVVTAEDIKRSGATNLPDALRTVVGIHVMNISPAQMEVGVRGFSKIPSNKIKLLIDGFPFTLCFYDMLKFNILPINLDEIERIEIMSGAGSVSYGSGALLGVINIITKNPKDTKGSSLFLAGGEKNTFLGSYSFGNSGFSDKLNYRVSAGRTEFGEWGDICGPYADEVAYQLWKFNTSMEYSLKENSTLSLTAGYISGIDELTSRTSGIGDIPSETCYDAGFTFKSKHIKASVFQRDFEASEWRTLKMKKSLNTPDKPYHYLTNDIKTNSELEYFTDISNDSILVGAGHMDQTIDTNVLLPPCKYKNYLDSIWAENTYKFSNNLIFNLGYRNDNHSDYGSINSQKAAFIVPVKEQSFRLTYGTSMRYPDFTEAYFGPDYSGYNTTFVRAVGLKPETATTYEIGYIGNLGKINIASNVFYTQVKDFIGFRYVTLSPAVGGKTRSGRAYNLGDGDESGADIELKCPFTSWAFGRVNYTYMDAKRNSTDVPPEYVTATPKNIANAELSTEFKNGISANLQASYVDYADFVVLQSWDNIAANEVGGMADPYCIVNARIAYTFVLWKNTTEVALSGFNILNKEHNEYPVRNALVARRVTASIAYKF
ncbi:MAG: TonB-dependent receptor [Elusimicrobia bacterium]|nr:TonB-dependent receptor [Candidatus Liberimonas magnetica]